MFLPPKLTLKRAMIHSQLCYMSLCTLRDWQTFRHSVKTIEQDPRCAPPLLQLENNPGLCGELGGCSPLLYWFSLQLCNRSVQSWVNLSRIDNVWIKTHFIGNKISKINSFAHKYNYGEIIIIILIEQNFKW